MEFNERQLKVINSTEPKILALAAAASGKALPNSVLLPTPMGSRRVSEIKVGDYLFDRNGKSTKVLGVYPQGKFPIYLITFSDGRKVKCSKEHIWAVNYKVNEEYEWKNLTLEEILKENILDENGNFKFSIPRAAAVQYEEKEFPFEPKEIASLVNSCLLKKIPEGYKYGSIEQRKELLDGFISVFGSPEEDSVVISLRDYLRNYLRDIAYSLGYAATIENNSLKIFKNKEKLYITDIMKFDYEEEMTCFYVDNEEHLFLTENFIVTHNTKVLTERIRHLIEDLKVSPEEIVAICFTNMAADEMKKRIGTVADKSFIGTLHSYANKICALNGIDTSNYIEETEFDKILEKALTISKDRYPKIKHLLVDECQDLSELEHRFIAKIPTENIFFTGDDRQMIYGFKGVKLEDLFRIYRRADFEKYYLVQNYRNAPNIIKFAEDFIHGDDQLSPPSIPMKTKLGTIETCSFRSALEELKEDGNWGSWFILARTNNELVDIQDILKEEEIPSVTFKKGDLELIELEELMASNRVKLLSIHTSKGSEASNVIVVGAKTYSPEERRIAYVAATRAKNTLYWCSSFSKRGKRNKSYIKSKTFFDKTNNGIIEFN